MTLKGYPDQKKTNDGRPEFATVNPIRRQQNGLDVVAHISAQLVASDLAETGSTNRIINATGHSAVRGDVISWTSGALAKLEVRVYETATDTITLAEELPAAPSNGDGFDILRQKVLKVDDEGNLSISLDVDSGLGPVEGDTLRTVAAGLTAVDKVYNDYSSASVSDSAYRQLFASTARDASRIYIHDTGGYPLVVAFGAAASEADQFYIGPGFGGFMDLEVAAGTRVSVKCLASGVTISSGALIVSTFGAPP